MNITSFSSALLNRRDWVYLLSLLIPLVVYDLILKASDIASLPSDHGPAQTFELIRSNVFFDLGYALLWIGLFSAARGRWALGWVVVFVFHVASMFVLLIITGAHQYFRWNGSTLDYSTVFGWVPKFKEIEPALIHDVSLLAWILLVSALFYAALGPWLVTRSVERWRRQSQRSPRRSTVEISFLGPLSLCFLALGFGSLSLVSGTTAFAKAPPVNMIATGIEQTSMPNTSDAGSTGEASSLDVESPLEYPPTHTGLAQTSQTTKRNVVLIHLESTRERSITPYNEDLKTTPFLDELAKSSLLAERAYVVVPRSSKATVAVNCGIEPALYPGPEFGASGIPAHCLPHLLKEQGYRTVFFTSVSSTMDSFGDVTKNLGYDEFYPSESMDTEGFQVTNSFGYEEDIMLRPSEGWLRAYGDKPFLAEYMTGTGHYGYECIPNRYGTKDFSDDDDQVNHYLNCLRYLDFFLKNLFDQYKRLGLYDNTIFILFGDHGEGFGEHGRFMHGDTIWEEGLRIPLIIHAPGWFEDGKRVEGASDEIDVLPTVLEMLGYKVKDGEYPGYSLLHPLPNNRILRFSCITNRKCLASIKGNEKYIYHYDNQPDEIFDLSKDPLEKQNLASEYSKGDLDKRREDLLAWRSRVNAEHGDILINGSLYSGE